MMVLKEKRRRRKKVSNTITLDTDINNKFNKFQNEKINYDKNVENLLKMKKEYDDLNVIPLKNLGETKLEYKLTLYETIINLENKLNNIKNNTNINSFLLKNNHLLYNYYDDTNKNNKQIKSNSILNFFVKSTDNLDELSNNSYNLDNSSNNLDNSSNNLDKSSNNLDKSSNNLDKSNKKKYDKSKLLNQYFNKVNPTFLNTTIYEICEQCNIEKTYYENEALLICESCGVQKNIIMDIDRPSFKDPPKEISYFAYKRINHFNEWLAQLQAKESTDIPQEIYDLIKMELKKETYINIKTLKVSKVRTILKKLGLNKYYEHVPHIINRLNGINPPILDNEVEIKLRMMFTEIQTPWIKHCPNKRSNFLSYSYVLYKCLQLLEMDHFLKNFNLLKSREKLAEQDQLWKLICKDVRWEFIKTI
jgi:hypothetical protein